MFVHYLHVSFVGAYQVFDKMLKWHFGVVLDSNEYQTLGITMVIHICFTHFDPNGLGHALLMHHITHHMHTWCTHLFTCHVLHFTYARYMFLQVLALITWFCDIVYVIFRDFEFVLRTNLVLIKFVFLFLCFCTCIFVFVSVFADVSY